MKTLEFAFYSFGVLAILYETAVLCNTQYFAVLYKNLHERKKENDEARKANGFVRIYSKPMLWYMAFDIVYFFWTVVGLFTTQWFFFVGIRVLSLKMGGHRDKQYYVFLDSLLSITILVLLFLNKYVWLHRWGFEVHFNYHKG